MNPQMPQMPQMPKFSGTSQMWYVPRKNIFSKQDDVLSAAERYMEENGTEAFERLITKVHIIRIFWWPIVMETKNLMEDFLCKL